MGRVTFDDFETIAARQASAERAVSDRSEAWRYLGVLALEIVAAGALIVGSSLGIAWMIVASLVLLVPCGWYFTYLAQRARERVQQGDYLIGVRLQWQAAGYSLGRLVPRAWQVLRSPG